MRHPVGNKSKNDALWLLGKTYETAAFGREDLAFWEWYLSVIAPKVEVV